MNENMNENIIDNIEEENYMVINKMNSKRIVINDGDNDDKIKPDYYQVDVNFIKDFVLEYAVSSFMKNWKKFIKENKVNVDSDKSKLYSAIDVLINTSKTSSNVDKIFEAKLEIVDYILNNKKESTTVEGYGLPNSVLSEIAVEKFNEEYGDLTDSEKEAISVSVGSDEIKKEELYTKTIKECLELVNSKLSESNGDVKEKLLATKENLLNRVYVKESFVNDISKVIELKKYLSDN
jgi:hypothetical protein